VFADYLRELQKVELLDSPHEGRLWRAYKGRGDGRSRARLIEAYQPLVFKVVMHLRLPGTMVMDMIQEGTVGLIEAVERFDPGRGVRFSTFATYRIRGRILNALRRERPAQTGDADVLAHGSSGSRRGPSFGYAVGTGMRDADHARLEKVPDPTAADGLAAVEDAVLLDQIVVAINRLPAREKRILRGSYLREEEPQRIAGELKISLSHFYRLQKQALHRIQAIITPMGLRPQGAQE
jgi:RNA polymerase sporulation-specific sigma factor